MVLKLYDCDVVLTLEGVNYQFEHVDSVTIEDPRRSRLTRGANAGNTTGITYMEGLKEPVTATLALLDIPMALHNLLKQAFSDQTRVDLSIISRQDASGKFIKNGVISNEPQQLTLDDSVESLNTELIFESFNVTDIMKS